MKMDDRWYMDWYWKEATEKEKQLLDKMYDLGPLFEDMLFERGTDTYDLIQCDTKDSGTGEWVEDEVPRPDAFEYFSYTFFHIRVEETEGCDGYYNH